jgi:hypothetical protein
VSWLEDFSDGESIWTKLMGAPSFDSFLRHLEDLTPYEWRHVLLYHAIAEKQRTEEWASWTDGG